MDSNSNRKSIKSKQNLDSNQYFLKKFEFESKLLAVWIRIRTRIDIVFRSTALNSKHYNALFGKPCITQANLSYYYDVTNLYKQSNHILKHL